MYYCNPEGFRKEIKRLLEAGDIDAFYNWFDGGETKEGAFEKGADVFNRVIFPYADKSRLGAALDLGYGAGTKVQAALNFFSTVYGVDVHEEFDFVFENLQVPKDKEVRLLSGDGVNIPVGSDQIDFLFSWVTFCHIGTIENVQKYLKEIYRVLKPGGRAALFYTRLIRSGKSQKWVEVLADMNKEKEHKPGYREGGTQSKVRTINLVIAAWKMEQLTKEANFDVLTTEASWDDTREGKVYHGQYGTIVQKPQPKKKAAKRPAMKRRKK